MMVQPEDARMRGACGTPLLFFFEDSEHCLDHWRKSAQPDIFEARRCKFHLELPHRKRTRLHLSGVSSQVVRLQAHGLFGVPWEKSCTFCGGKTGRSVDSLFELGGKQSLSQATSYSSDALSLVFFTP